MKPNPKASEVYEKTDFRFGQQTLETMFPGVEKVEVGAKESDSHDVAPHQFCHWNGGLFVDCSNRVCFNGGADLRPIIAEMVGRKATETEATCDCRGFEGSAKGATRYGSCLHRFTVKIKLTYKTDSRIAESEK